MQPTNAELLRACLSGEEAAWRTLLLRYEGLIYSIPLHYRMSKEEADDVFQNVCLALLEHLGSLRDPERLTAWLVTTTRRECWARWRTKSREESLPPDSLSGGDDLDPEEWISLFEESREISAALDQLPDRCRHLLRRLYLDPEPATYVQLAKELAMPVNSLGPTRARCLERLVQLLQDRASAHVLSRSKDALIS